MSANADFLRMQMGRIERMDAEIDTLRNEGYSAEIDRLLEERYALWTWLNEVANRMLAHC